VWGAFCAHILYERFEKLSARRFIGLLPVTLTAPELDARAPLGFRARKIGALEIISTVLDVRAKFLLDLGVHL
jgi:hypothetical protein